MTAPAVKRRREEKKEQIQAVKEELKAIGEKPKTSTVVKAIQGLAEAALKVLPTEKIEREHQDPDKGGETVTLLVKPPMSETMPDQRYVSPGDMLWVPGKNCLEICFATANARIERFLDIVQVEIIKMSRISTKVTIVFRPPLYNVFDTSLPSKVEGIGILVVTRTFEDAKGETRRVGSVYTPLSNVNLTKKVILQDRTEVVYHQLIGYIHKDDRCVNDINKAGVRLDAMGPSKEALSGRAWVSRIPFEDLKRGIPLEDVRKGASRLG